MTWAENEYIRYLDAERRAFAWVMTAYGDMAPPQAVAAALERYPYEPPDSPHRGLIFHDEAWHWAMLRIHGETYMIEHPDLAVPPAAYRALK